MQPEEMPPPVQSAEHPTEVAAPQKTVETEGMASATAPPMPMDPAEAAPAETVVLVKKHPRAIRWMHWINFPVLTIMIWSGLLIYWGDSTPPYQHAHQVYRVGIGSFTLFRLFPDWFWKMLDAPYRITVGLGWHFLVMWIFGINGIVYALYLAISGEWRVLWPEFRQLRSFRDAIQVTLYDMHWPAARRKGLPAQGKYNGAQRIAYTAVTLMGAGSLITGLAIYKPTQAHWFTTLLGGYEMARWEHFWLTIFFCLFFLVHVAQVVLAGWNNFRSMVSGYEIQKRDAARQPIDANSGEPTGAMHEAEPIDAHPGSSGSDLTDVSEEGAIAQDSVAGEPEGNQA